MQHSIFRRWFVNTIGIVLVVLVTLVIILSLTVQNYAYSNISNTLTGRMDELINVLSSAGSGYFTDFNATVREYVENFPDKNDMELMAIDKMGRVFITSTGFPPNIFQEMQDYNISISSPDNSGTWSGKLDTGEKVTAITRTVRDQDGNLIGSMRYIVSLEKADQQIMIIRVALVLVGVLIMLFLVVSGVYFVRSIITPIRQVTASARQISHGDFDVRIEKTRDDEIGQLCDSINDMASELGTTDRMKNDFISSVSHELRTPLTSIKGWAETLGGGVDSEIADKGVNVIIRESERLTGLVENLLDFSRLQNAAMKLNVNRVDILAELDSAVFMFTDRAKTEDKTLNYEENLSLSQIYGDIDRLRQVFVNIIDNALKYTQKGGTIDISTAEGDGYVYVTVKDNGCGIPKEHLQNVKKKFYKANQLVPGSGIGLALADEIVILHCGKLDIDSEEGEGTRVKVSLPTTQYLQKHPEICTTPEIAGAIGK